MALIKGRRGRTDGGYTRLFGDERLGRLFSRVHGAVISSGSELERFVLERSKTIEDIDAFLDLDVIPEGIFVAPKKVLKESSTIDYRGVEPDFVAFERRNKRRQFYIIELKDGDNFDTKKAAGERNSLHKYMNAISQHVEFRTSVHFCCFNSTTRAQVVEGFKRKITEAEALTGREFCDLLHIDYDDLIVRRLAHQGQNFEHLISSLLTIPRVVDEIVKRSGSS